MEKMHADRLEADGLDAAQAVWLSGHDSLNGTCMCGCGRVTSWNSHTGKPSRVSDDPACRARLRAKASKNISAVYGTDNLLADMEHQKEIMKKRHIAGKYRFKDGGEIEYMGTLEKNWLQFCDTVLDLTSNMIQDPPENFQYFDPKDQKMHYYLPDYYLPDYNLIVEIKDGGSMTNTNPEFQRTTGYKVALKDEVMKKQDKYNYIRIRGTNYGPFVEMLFQIVHEKAPDGKKRRAMVVITENACCDPEEQLEDKIDFNRVEPVRTDRISLLVGYLTGTNIPSYIAISDSKIQASWYVTDLQNQELFHVSFDHPIFATGGYRMFKYVGDAAKMQQAFPVIVVNSDTDNGISEWDISRILLASGIYIDDGVALRNNNERKMDFVLTDTYFSTAMPIEEGEDEE